VESVSPVGGESRTIFSKTQQCFYSNKELEARMNYPMTG